MKNATITMEAVGLLIGFYRRRKGMLQAELAKKSKIPASSIAMFEAGKRLPKSDKLQKILECLGLNPYEAINLQAVAGHPHYGMGNSAASFLPQDVTAGMPIFLRTLEQEFHLQEKSGVKEAWICALDGVLGIGEADPLHRLVQLWIKKGISVTIFLNLRDRISFWDQRFTAQGRISKAKRTWQLKQLPLNACPYSFILFDPGFTTSMVGRSIFCHQGFPAGTLPMDRPEIERAWEILNHFSVNE